MAAATRPEDARTLGQLSGALEGIPSHGTRMRYAADVGRVLPKAHGHDALERFLKEAAGCTAWEGIYVVVVAQAAGAAACLNAICLNHQSWVVRARAAQALGKVNPEGAAALLCAEGTPVQLRPLLARAATYCTSETLELVLGAPWGGAGDALMMLRRCPGDAHHAALVGNWLPRLLSMATVQRKELKRRLTSKELDARIPDGQFVLQGFAAKHPQAVLEMLRNNWEWSDMWHRAAQLLAATHPDEVLAVLRKVKGYPRAAWILAQPIARHRPLELLEVLAHRGTFDDCARRCLRNIIDGIQLGETRVERSEVLRLTGDIIKAPRPNDVYALSQMLSTQWLLHPRRSSCAAPLCWEIAVSLANVGHLGHELQTMLRYFPPPTDTQLALLFTSARRSGVAASTSQEVLRLLSTGPYALPEPRLAAAWRSSDDAKGALTIMKMLQPGSPALVTRDSVQALFGALPKSLQRGEAERLFADPLFAEWPSEAQVEVIVYIPVKVAFPRLKKLATDRNAMVRAHALNSVLTCGMHSEEMKDALTWVEQRLQNEQTEVKEPVVRRLLREVPVGLFLPEHVPVLSSLLAGCLGSPSWVQDWVHWVARLVAHELAKLRAEEPPAGELLTFSGQVTEQLAAASLHADNPVRLMRDAAAILFQRCNIPDPSRHPCVPHAVSFLVGTWLAPTLTRTRAQRPLSTIPPTAHCVGWLRDPRSQRKAEYPEHERCAVLLEEARFFVQGVTPAGTMRCPKAQADVGALLGSAAGQLRGGELKHNALLAEYLISYWVTVQPSGELLPWQPLQDAVRQAVAVVRTLAAAGEQWPCPKGTPGSCTDLMGSAHMWTGTIALVLAQKLLGELLSLERHSQALARGLLRRRVEQGLGRMVSQWLPPRYAPLLELVGDAVAALSDPPSGFQEATADTTQCLLEQLPSCVYRWAPGLARGAAAAAAVGIRFRPSPPPPPTRPLTRAARMRLYGLGRKVNAANCIREVVQAARAESIPLERTALDQLAAAARYALGQADSSELPSVLNTLMGMADICCPDIMRRIERVVPRVCDMDVGLNRPVPVKTRTGNTEGRRPRYRWQRGQAATRRRALTKRKKAATARDWAASDAGPDGYAPVRALVLSAVEAAAKLVHGYSNRQEEANAQEAVRGACHVLSVVLQCGPLSARRAVVADAALGLLRKAINVPELRTRTISCVLNVRDWVLNGRGRRTYGTEVHPALLGAWPPLGALLEAGCTLPPTPRKVLQEEVTHHNSRGSLEEAARIEAHQVRATAISVWLAPRWLRHRRAAQLLDSPLGAELIVESEALSGYAARDRQDMVHLALASSAGLEAMKRFKRWPLNAFVRYGPLGPPAERFAGQICSVAPGLCTLPPKVQRVVYDEWVDRYGFELQRQSVGGQFDEDLDRDEPPPPAGAVSLGHKRQTMVLWLAAAMPCPHGVPPVTDKAHPFAAFLAQAQEDSEAVRAADEDARKQGAAAAARRKSKGEVALEVTRARRARLAKELISGIRIIDTSAAALQVLSEQITAGLSTHARPGMCDALRCVNPDVAARYIEAVLSRRHSRKADVLAAGAGARSQLVRAVVRCQLPSTVAEEMLLSEWAGRGAAPGAEEGEVAPTAKDIKLNIVAALATSRIPRESPKLWRLFEEVADGARKDAASDERYITTELLKALAGESATDTMNAKQWPREAPDGLAGMCATLAQVQALQPLCFKVLDRWQSALQADPMFVVSQRDCEEVVAAAGWLMDEDAAKSVSLLMALDSRGRPGTLLAATKKMTQTAEAARKVFDVHKELKVRSGILAIGTLPNWQLREARQSVAEVATYLIGARMAQVGISLRVSLLDFTAPQGPEQLCAELTELAAATAAVDWLALCGVLYAALLRSVTNQTAARGDQCREPLGSVVDTFTAAQGTAGNDLYCRYVAVVLCEAVLSAGGEANLGSEWGRRLYRLRDDGCMPVSASADEAFGRMAEKGVPPPTQQRQQQQSYSDDDDDSDY
eukprot:TRINITY_DN2553_c0_g1_i12.p1 TRINITY_DN2553_c0_g1~~TRINITY_DN2553_c0_g1_i12.p1  ORF type:complete len:2028 (+),score=615.84 TRINITY_DN2553_c0_g1_i12:122-6085(+)